MTVDSKSSGSEMPKRKSFLSSLSDRSRRSLVYNVQEAESLSTCSTDHLEDKIDRLTDDLQSLNNTLRAVAHRVADLEKIVSDKTNAITPVAEKVDAPLRRSYVRERSVTTKNVVSDKPKIRTEMETVIKHELYRTVPKILVICCNLIEDKATIMPVDRLYQTNADQNEVKAIMRNIRKDDWKCLEEVKNIHTLVGVLKAFFEELRIPLITGSEIQAFIGSSPKMWIQASNSERIESLQKLVKSLPETNRDSLKYFIRHLKRLCRDYSKILNSRNLAIGISPSILQTITNKRQSTQENLKDYDNLNNYLQFMIDHCESIFRTKNRNNLRRTLERCISCPGLSNV